MFKVIHSTSNWLQVTQNWLHTQVHHLPAARVEAHVVCRRQTNFDQFSVSHLHVLPGPWSWEHWWEKTAKISSLRRHSPLLVSTARRIGAQLVHSHFGPGGWRDAPSAQRLGTRQVVTFYGYDVRRLPQTEPVWYERYAELFAHVDRVLCEGPFMARSIVNDLGCPPHKIQVHHLGVDTKMIAYAPRQWTHGTPLRVLIAASFLEKKGIPDALRAIARLKEVVSLKITIIGDAHDKPDSQNEKLKILNSIEEGALGPFVRRLGYQPHAKLFEEAYRNHVFLSPSLSANDGDCEGGAPVAIIEMAATGMPIVSTRHCDIPMVIEPGRTGLLADERDVDGLVAHLNWLVQNPDGWRPMLDAARRHVEQEFDAGLQGTRLADIYAEVIDGETDIGDADRQRRRA
jgi:colanic acid/amylovoran/stewartan biosynthesis glycosyltransferase WcaL/AmsK/CpsK